MNRLIGIFAILCGAMLSACAQPEDVPAVPGGQDTPSEKPCVSSLTAPKDGLSVNLDAISDLTFWWKQAGGKVDGYELAIDIAGGDFTSSLASFPAGNATEISVLAGDMKTIYNKVQENGVAELAWTVFTVSGDVRTAGKEQRRLTLTNTVTPYVVDALFTPESGGRIDLVLQEDDIEFTWAPASGLKTPSYTVLLDVEGHDFSSPLVSFDAGEQTSVTVALDEMRKIYSSNVAAGSEILRLEWAVRSTVEDNSWISGVRNRLLVTNLPVAYSNAIFTGFSLPDPDVIRADDGYFYLYATEHNRNDANMKNSPIMRSSDLVNWTRAGAMFTDSTHPQITDQNPAGIWAPSVNMVGNRYVIYYSQPGKNYKHAIGVAVSDNPAGPFTDLGKLIDSNEQGVDISIDAYLYQEDGRNYLFWGSFRSISVLELTADGTAIKNKATQKRIEVAGGQYEASVVLKRDGYYYLIVSTGDYSKGGTYRLVVGRSKSIFGPYVDKDGNDMMSVHHELMLKGNDTFSSPGHCSRIITDDEGQDWILYHAYPNDKDFRCLMLDRVNWVDGWPVCPGLQPSSRSVARPVFK
ncbi:MAG: family 43 glycosylhydrolase [Clostridium sp.]|nr:family 43 glycosylhydrolase [Bacteroides sp.]MCM1198470.1 family 43 glycosylhydrolase [Clostridium sp.]